MPTARWPGDGSIRSGATRPPQPPPQRRLPYYRKIPGQRRYYDPVTGRTISEYKYRKLIRTFSPETREAIQAEREKTRQESRADYSRLMRSYQAKQAAEGNVMNLNQVRSSADFRDKVERLRYYRYLTRNTTIGNIFDPNDPDARYQMLAPDGAVAQVLVALGRRPEGADWMVGMSAAQPGWVVGGYHG